ncbi:MAG: LLM class flavin-dependent oxidoreductase [Ilumatobacteraceae bacterium]
MFPPPFQQSPPIWITAGGSPDTFTMAGEIGAGILTNLLVMSEDELVANIGRYRAARRGAGHVGDGHVTLMLHTYVGAPGDDVRSTVREPFLAYLRSSTDLINKVRWEQTSFAKPGTNGNNVDNQSGVAVGGLDELDDDEMSAIMDHAFDRYFDSAGLFGDPQECIAKVDRLRNLGIDEIACLIDFGVESRTVLAALANLEVLRESSNAPPQQHTHQKPGDFDLVAQVIRHSVTHLQCTPSFAAIVAAQDDGLAALAKLDWLLLGGEALPAALVARIRPALRGRLLNMYGPTETTIWSTVAQLEPGEEITIGRPIANTEIHIVDHNIQPNPIGVAGELLIGGAGVVRGYLDRPALTAERFVELDAGRRVYRTGDLARHRSDGRIEFLGRLDHQVKIRGFRIELGEIEAAIGRHPDTFENVVVARTDTPGEPRLVAYVVPRRHSDDDAAATATWSALWNETYRTAGVAVTDDRTVNGYGHDATFDISGWVDSVTGDEIPAAEMREWVDQTVARVLGLSPHRVLEIGCGTGLLLWRIAPHCSRYVGIDPADAAIAQLAARLEAYPMAQVALIEGMAHDLASLTSERFDTVVINSVAQYFPDAEYLVNVIVTAFDALQPGGSLFLGDLRSLQHLPLFAASVELAKAPAGMTTVDLRVRIAQRLEGERELVVDPALFFGLRTVLAELDAVEVRLKEGGADNELTRFRYDVILHRADGERPRDEAAAVCLPAGEAHSLEALSTVIDRGLAGQPAVLQITGIRNDRLVREAELVRLLADPERPAGTVAELRESLAAVSPGLRPGDLVVLDPRSSADLLWSAAGPDRVDLVLRSRPGTWPPTEFIDHPSPWSTYTNRPTQHTSASLAAELRTHLRTTLAEHMVPTAFVVLDTLPRTPNGKIDRNALPAPSRGRVEAINTEVAPEGDLERLIAELWQDLLMLDHVSVETNLFDLGANSLMMVRASGRLGETIGRRVSLVEMFHYPTVRALAAHLGDGTDSDADIEELHDSRDRGQSRKDALRRRRESRRG